ncbi:MAG: DUF4169 family protein [Myxococcota bacterium]
MARARKRKARAAKAREAESNRAREGQTRAERRLHAKQEADRARRLAGVRRDPPDPR